MNATAATEPPPYTIPPFAHPDAARVWNYWFAHRDLTSLLRPAADPFADSYKLDQALWFRGGPAVDAEIARHFEALVTRAGRGELDAWRDNPRECLSLVLLLDQFPRNIHRGTAQAFAHDARAITLGLHALERGFDRLLAPGESLFFFMALTHSEELGHVRAALAGITELATRCTRGQQRLASSWRVGTQKHVDVLERFGRYPHRNAALGRESTAAEEAFLQRPEFKALFMRSQLPRGDEREAPVRAAPAPRRPRLRILALHGFRQNGDVFRSRTRKMRHALEDIAELTFVTSPMSYTPRGDTRAATIAAFGELPEYPMQRVWWLSSEDNSDYDGFDASVAWLESVFRAHGPFDGVVGFAQGATLAAVLAAMQPHPAIAFKFAICISGFPSRARAHAEYVQRGSVSVPTLHVLGLNDILVTPDRSLDLFNVFDPSTSVLVKHAGGHFVPSAWPYKEIHAFAERFMGEAPPAVIDAAPAPPAPSLLSLACEALSAPIDLPAVQSILEEMADQQLWKELQAMALRAWSLRTERDRDAPETSSLAAVHEYIVGLFAQRLRADLAVVARKGPSVSGTLTREAERRARLLPLLTPRGVLEGAIGASNGDGASLCARDAPRIGSGPDKASHLARDIAAEVFRREDMLAFIESRERAPEAERRTSAPEGHVRRRERQSLDPQTQARYLSYQRYCQALSVLVGVLAEMDPTRASEQMRKLREARSYAPEHLLARRALPISEQVTEPEPEPVLPCTLDDLKPLLEHLRSNVGVEHQTAFSRGTITTDGRLDLCKQVVGPEGIRPLLDAMMFTDRVKRLLLGNNIVGDGGAAAIAGFLRERRDSPLDCWYIAGNHIGPEGIGHVCEALMGDTRVTSLWLKRNPLKAAGMAHVARLLRANATLEVLDLVNCGLLDEGLTTVLGALMGPGANKTLKHLYLGTNGVTVESAGLLSDFLANDCALESLYLSCNRLGDEGVAIVARGLAANRTLRRVSFASNRVGPEGAAALSSALREHPSIQLLDLGFTKATVAVGELGNLVGDEGARALARMLEGNTTLRSLDLLHNFISQVGVNHIREALKRNTTLVSLQLTQFGKVHNEPGKEELRAALARNRALVSPDEADAVSRIDLPDHITEIYSVYRTRS